ncbi:MAG: flagellar hook-length control protein FliK [Clostridiales bacterium]|nr:flagellar hook-length control protein FliK [Clostridiales bacterium]
MIEIIKNSMQNQSGQTVKDALKGKEIPDLFAALLCAALGQTVVLQNDTGKDMAAAQKMESGQNAAFLNVPSKGADITGSTDTAGQVSLKSGAEGELFDCNGMLQKGEEAGSMVNVSALDKNTSGAVLGSDNSGIFIPVQGSNTSKVDAISESSGGANENHPISDESLQESVQDEKQDGKANVEANKAKNTETFIKLDLLKGMQKQETNGQVVKDGMDKEQQQIHAEKDGQANQGGKDADAQNKENKNSNINIEELIAHEETAKSNNNEDGMPKTRIEQKEDTASIAKGKEVPLQGNVFKPDVANNVADSVKAFNAENGGVPYIDKEDVLNQIYDKIKLLRNNGVSELRVSLKPPELGDIDIKLVMEKGNMLSKIIVENSHVKDMLESSIPEIKESLKDQNVDVSKFSISVGLEHGDTHSFNSFANEGRQFYKRSYGSHGGSADFAGQPVAAEMNSNNNSGIVNMLA